MLGVLLGCSFDLPAPTNEAGDDDPDGDSGTAHIAAVPLRRLTRDQFVRTIEDLFGPALPEDLALATMLPVDDHDGGFAANTTAVTETIVEQYERASEAIADAVVTRRASLHPCLAEPTPDRDCASSFLAAFAPRALRRPLPADERDALLAILWPSDTTASEEVDRRLRAVVSLLLQSPDFLYRIARGEPGGDGLDPVRLTGHEIAARMSYLIWATMPDEALTADAAAGRLLDPGFRTIVLQRLLDDPRARDGLGVMHRQWLAAQALDPLVKDRNQFPSFTEALGPELSDELTHFVDRAIRQRDGTLHTLLTANVTVGSIAVATWYGDDVIDEQVAPSFPAGTAELTLDPTHRGGVLTLLSVMAAHAKTDGSDPIGRGALVRERLLCQPLLSPPPGVAAPPGAPLPGASLREQLAQHTADPSCATCHALIDPIGFAFEGYDAMGVFRTHDAAGNPIDAAGEVPASDIEGTFDGAVTLGAALARSDQVERCYATQWFRYAVGRLDDEDDREPLAALQQGFAEAGGHIPTLLRLLVASDAFVQRRPQ